MSLERSIRLLDDATDERRSPTASGGIRAPPLATKTVSLTPLSTLTTTKSTSRRISRIKYYKLQSQCLGKGNFARVELAVHALLGVKIALKIIDVERVKEQYVLANLEREARMLNKLSHPNVIALFDAFRVDNMYILSMEYASGGDLVAYIKRQPRLHIDEETARIFFSQLVAAIAYMHRVGVVHRDLKLENILLDASERFIKIVDFGLSNEWSPKAPLYTNCGSPEYAAPELYEKGRPYGPESDIWSMGVILYGMTVGSLPFSIGHGNHYDSKRKENLRAQIAAGLSFYHRSKMRNFSRALRELVESMVSGNPTERAAIADIIQHAWLRRGHLPSSAIASSGAPSTSREEKVRAVARLALLLCVPVAKLVERLLAGDDQDGVRILYRILLVEQRNQHFRRQWPCDEKEDVESVSPTKLRIRGTSARLAVRHAESASPPRAIHSAAPRRTDLDAHDLAAANLRCHSAVVAHAGAQQRSSRKLESHQPSPLEAAHPMQQPPDDCTGKPPQCTSAKSRRRQKQHARGHTPLASCCEPSVVSSNSVEMPPYIVQKVERSLAKAEQALNGFATSGATYRSQEHAPWQRKPVETHGYNGSPNKPPSEAMPCAARQPAAAAAGIFQRLHSAHTISSRYKIATSEAASSQGNRRPLSHCAGELAVGNSKRSSRDAELVEVSTTGASSRHHRQSGGGGGVRSATSCAPPQSGGGGTCPVSDVADVRHGKKLKGQRRGSSPVVEQRRRLPSRRAHSCQAIRGGCFSPSSHGVDERYNETSRNGARRAIPAVVPVLSTDSGRAQVDDGYLSADFRQPRAPSQMGRTNSYFGADDTRFCFIPSGDKRDNLMPNDGQVAARAAGDVPLQLSANACNASSPTRHCRHYHPRTPPKEGFSAPRVDDARPAPPGRQRSTLLHGAKTNAPRQLAAVTDASSSPAFSSDFGDSLRDARLGQSTPSARMSIRRSFGLPDGAKFGYL